MRHLSSVRLIVVSIAADALIIGARAVCADTAPGAPPDRRVETPTLSPGPAEPSPNQAVAEEAGEAKEQRADIPGPVGRALSDGTASPWGAIPPAGTVAPWHRPDAIREIQHSYAMHSDRWTQPVPVGCQP
jgi:hypothetical protein